MGCTNFTRPLNNTWISEACSALFRKWVAVTSNNLKISCVWKSLVASCACVCVCLCDWSSKACFQFTRSSPALNCSSPTWNAVVSNAKSFRLQHRIRSSLAISAFVCTQLAVARIYINYARFTYLFTLRCTYMYAIHVVNAFPQILWRLRIPLQCP